MAQLTGVSINRMEGGLGRRADNTDSVFLLVSCMPMDTLTDLEEYKAVRLMQTMDAEQLGITPAYDANQSVLAHHHISEVFRLAPDATLYFAGVEPADGVDSNVKDYIAGLLPTIRANKDIKGIGFVGFDDNLNTLSTHIDLIETSLVDALALENRFIDFVVLEGKSSGAIVVNNLVDLRTKNAKHCSVVVAQDPHIVALGEGDYDDYAAVGSAMGMLAVRKINENIGSVNIKDKPRLKKAQANYPLTDGVLWLKGWLSDGQDIESLSKVDLKSINDKGYIYAASYEGYAGVYFQNSPTAIAKTSDYAYIENNRVWNKAARVIRLALLPVVKSTVKKDPQSGFIKSTTISYWEGLVNKALENMMIDDEISGFDFYINGKQIVNDESPVTGKAQIVSDGIVHEFEIDLGLTNQVG